MSKETTFSSLGLNELLLRAIEQAGLKKPTPVQEKAIPMGLTGRDILASAQTGTGKTAAFALPVLHRLLEMRATKQVRAVVLVPTRELAVQVLEQFQQFVVHTELKCAAVFGGVDVQEQLKAMEGGVDVLVATPGRLLDMLGRKQLSLSALRMLVLDEADRMLDLGFKEEIEKIVAHAPAKRQNLLFSATFSKDIKQLAHDFMRHPVKVEIENPNSAAKTVEQSFYAVEQPEKPEILAYLLQNGGWAKAIVFVRTKKGASKVASLLMEEGVSAQEIHSDLSQYQRLRTLEDFKENYFDVLVATDVAARGLDIEQLPLVVNYDLPKNPQDYIHRIGRTGRARMKGRAISLINGEEKKLLQGIKQLTKRSAEIEPLPYFDVEPTQKPVKKKAPARKPFKAVAKKPQPGSPRNNRSGKPAAKRTTVKRGR